MGIERGSSRSFQDSESLSKAEEVTLRFPEVYQSPEWKELSAIDRAQLLLVAEGVKPGTIIGGDSTNFQRIIHQLNLDSSFNTDPLLFEPVYMVSSSDRLSAYHREVVSVPEGASDVEFHRINGRFLGYPPCCTEEYIKPQKNMEARKQHSPQTFLSNVDFDVHQMLEQGRAYPEELDYAPPSFTPCSATCEHALATLSNWKKILNQADPDAARELQHFNWQSEPYYSAHQEEMQQLRINRKQERKIQFLRRSAGLEN